MRKIYFLLSVIFLVLVAANIYYYLNIYRQQVNFQENMLVRQTEICSWEIEQHVSNFMNELNYILFTEDMSEFFRDPAIRESSIRKMEVFFSKYLQLITSISLYDDENNAFSIFKDRNNNLITDIYRSRLQRELYDIESMDDYDDESVFVLPAFRDNRVAANLVIRIDAKSYIGSVFSNFHIEDILWQWIINREGETVFSNFVSGVPNMTTTRLIAEKWPEDGNAQTLIHKIEEPGLSRRVISAWYPVKILHREMLVVFSLDTSIVISYIINSILTIAAATFIVLVILILFFLWFIRNERREKQKSRDSEQSLKQLFESLPVGILIKAADNRVRMINSTATEILGIENPEMVIGKDFSNMFFLHRNYAGSKSDDNEERTNEYVYYDSDENEVILYKREIPARFMGEKVFVDAFIDISPIEQARKNEYLFGEAKTEFLKRISHDIRNPLNGIIHMAATLEEKMKPGSDGHQKTDIIKRCCEDILLVVNDIMDFSSFEDNKTLVEEIPFVLHEEIDLAIRPVRTKAKEKKLKLNTRIAENIPKNLIGDPFHLRQVITNLLSNSLKYTSEGEIRLIVESARQKGGNITLRIKVEDTGTGIPAGMVDAFNNKEKLPDNIPSGNFGLNKTRQLVRLMKGDIRIESPLSSKSPKGWPGTRVIFTIQVYSNEISAKKLRIDHIENYKDIRALVLSEPGEGKPGINEMLRKLGISCETTVFNETTMDILRNRGDDPRQDYSIIVIVDSEKSNGFAITRKLHENHLDEKYLIIIISSANKPGNFIKSRRFGADHYLIEPYDASEIFDIIQNNFLHVAIPSAKTPHSKKTKPGLNILVAEDNHVNQIVAQSLFKSIGYDIDLASNGKEAVDKVRQKDYDIVFMDINMPEKNGLDATYDIRKLGYRMPIVAMTANASETDKTEAIGAGMNDFVPKPVRIELLKNILIKNFSDEGK